MISVSYRHLSEGISCRSRSGIRPWCSLILASQQPMCRSGHARQAQALRLQPGDERNGIDFIVPAGHSSGLSVTTLAFQLRRPPLPDSAPRGTGVVRGRVADLGGRPIGHAQVLVFADTRADSRATTTNENGAFEVGELGAGTVRISATAPAHAARIATR